MKCYKIEWIQNLGGRRFSILMLSWVYVDIDVAICIHICAKDVLRRGYHIWKQDNKG